MGLRPVADRTAHLDRTAALALLRRAFDVRRIQLGPNGSLPSYLKSNTIICLPCVSASCLPSGSAAD
jgi:hypothetical protein